MVTGTGEVAKMAQNSGVVTDIVKKPASEHRRSNKPIMEKRRRARINNCLNELKALILEAMKKDPARHSKLEKADILEMTVKHLETLQRQRTATEPEARDRFRAGYQECVQEVDSYQGIETALKRKLVQHLSSRLEPAIRQQDPEDQPQGTIYLSTGRNSGVRLVPTRLANGDIALVVPQSSVKACSTASSVSSLSTDQENDPNVRSYSPASTWSDSPPPQDHSPISLVMRRHHFDSHEDEKPWRPW